MRQWIHFVSFCFSILDFRTISLLTTKKGAHRMSLDMQQDAFLQANTLGIVTQLRHLHFALLTLEIL